MRGVCPKMRLSCRLVACMPAGWQGRPDPRDGHDPGLHGGDNDLRRSCCYPPCSSYRYAPASLDLRSSCPLTRFTPSLLNYFPPALISSFAPLLSSSLHHCTPGLSPYSLNAMLIPLLFSSVTFYPFCPSLMRSHASAKSALFCSHLLSLLGASLRHSLNLEDLPRGGFIVRADGPRRKLRL